jgi:hypothetical protein
LTELAQTLPLLQLLLLVVLDHNSRHRPTLLQRTCLQRASMTLLTY